MTLNVAELFGQLRALNLTFSEAGSISETLPVGSDKGHGDVWADIIAELPDGPLKTVCEERRAFGIAKHGAPLRYEDGRGPVDRLQEALDLAAYAWRDGEMDEHKTAMVLVACILRKMGMA